LKGETEMNRKEKKAAKKRAKEEAENSLAEKSLKNRVAMRNYGDRYEDLCSRRRRAVDESIRMMSKEEKKRMME